MKLDKLSIGAQDGLRLLGKEMYKDDLLFDGLDSNPEAWAWWWFILRETECRKDWFPKGKWATLQRIEDLLAEEAREFACVPVGRPQKEQK